MHSLLCLRAGTLLVLAIAHLYVGSIFVFIDSFVFPLRAAAGWLGDLGVVLGKLNECPTWSCLPGMKVHIIGCPLRLCDSFGYGGCLCMSTYLNDLRAS